MGGSLAWEGAILLQEEQASLVLAMSALMPGQKMNWPALAVMADVPWWAECRALRHAFLRGGGITRRPLKDRTPSVIDRSLLLW